jgi:hypothetical protein
LPGLGRLPLEEKADPHAGPNLRIVRRLGHQAFEMGQGIGGLLVFQQHLGDPQPGRDQVRVQLHRFVVVGRSPFFVVEPFQHQSPPVIRVRVAGFDLDPLAQAGVGGLVSQPKDKRPGHRAQDFPGIGMALIDDGK